ncbi:MAG TPA: hypothetical protein VN969_43340 [Streptosporangiaceae bacterium]|nr:hypothetical protein [Streptosporangiaceae bacterium]
MARLRVIPPGDHHPLTAVLPAYPELGYCGLGDPGHVVDISPAEPTIQAVFADRA